MNARARLVFASLALLAGCGGKVVVDQPGSGGSGGSGGGGAGDCSTLQGTLAAAVDAALSCNPYINSIQCNGTAIVHDACGCAYVANETNVDAVAAAQTAFTAWANAGCTLVCDACPPESPNGYCEPSTSKCSPAWLE
jgi:hypothetical protein